MAAAGEPPETAGPKRIGSRRQFLRVVGAAGLAAAANPAHQTPANATEPGRAQPNIVLVLVDDLAWSEFGCYGDSFNETPHVDALAAQGMRFTDAYASAPVCSPNRASIMTGQYPARVGITDYLRGQGDDFLDPAPGTLPALLSDAGYTTGIVGKWHLTETYDGDYRSRPGNPHAHGFDAVRASEREYIAGGDYFAPYFFLPQVDAPEGEYLTDRLNQEAVGFIERYADQPFFLYLSHYAVHTQLAGKPEKVQKYRDKPGAGEPGNNPELAAMLESIDDGVGMIVETLERLGLTENTLLLVMSDNGGDGGVASNAPLRASKTHLYEGGIRVPLIARWPGSVRPGVSDVPVNSIDLFPTFLELAGASAGADAGAGTGAGAGTEPAASAPVDGVSLAGLLTDGRAPERDALYWIYPHHHTYLGAVRQGSYKLVQFVPDGRVELYDLRQDIGEATDLAPDEPERAAALRDKLAAHIADTGLLPPVPTSSSYPVLDIESAFDPGEPGYDVLAPAPEHDAGVTAIRDGAFTMEATGPSFALLRSTVGPAGPGDVAITVQMGSFAGDTTSTQDTLFVGLVKDERNYVAIWHNRRRGRTGWDVVRDGELTGERVNDLDDEFRLDAPGARYGLVVHGGSLNAFADTGNGWNFVFTADVSELIALDDPDTMRDFRYGFGLRTDGGTIAVDQVRGSRSA